MILRKPYAVFIKYFKLLHVILFALTSLVLYRTITLYNFFNLYSNDYRSAIGDFTVGRYLNGFSFFVVVIVLILTIILLSVMLYKKKPKELYIYNLIIYIFVIVLYFFCDGALRDVSSVILDLRMSKALRDFTLIAIILETISLILVSVRATGFDIKRFDFGTDLQKLDISEKDSEEIEVLLDFDKDETKRNFKSRIRNIKYVYVEHKFLINLFATIFVVSICAFIYLNVRSYNVNYNQGQAFEASGLTFNVKDSYILDEDSNGNKIVDTSLDNAGAIVAIRFQVKGYGVNKELNTGLFNLRIGEFSYGQNADYAKKIDDLGEAYINQKINSEFETYILAFEIPASSSLKSMTLKVNDNMSFVNGLEGAKNANVKLKPTDLREEGSLIESRVSETMYFDESVLGASSLTINSFDINNKFKLGYKYCYSKDKCIDSTEYVTPTATGNYFKTLLKISGSVDIDTNLNIDKIYDFRTLLNSYGTINYLIGDEWKSKKIDSKLVEAKVAKTNDYFIEIPYEVKDATSINLVFNIRNKNYKYTLK